VENRNSLKLGQNYAYINPKLLQLLEDAPGPHWGSSVPRPLHRTFPHILCQVYAPVSHAKYVPTLAAAATLRVKAVLSTAAW